MCMVTLQQTKRQVVTGFPSFMVDVPETVLVTLVFLVVVKPRDNTPVALVLAAVPGRSVR